MCKSISFYENNIVNLSLRLSFLRDFTEFLAFLLGFPAFRLAVHSPPIRLFAFFYFYFYWVFPEFRLEVRSLLIHPFTFFYFSFYWASLYRRVLGFSSSWRPSGGPHLLFLLMVCWFYLICRLSPRLCAPEAVAPASDQLFLFFWSTDMRIVEGKKTHKTFFFSEKAFFLWVDGCHFPPFFWSQLPPKRRWGSMKIWISSSWRFIILLR